MRSSHPWSSMCQQKADSAEPTYSHGTITPVTSSSPGACLSNDPLERGRLLMFQGWRA